MAENSIVNESYKEQEKVQQDGLNEQKKGIETWDVRPNSNDSDLSEEIQEFEQQNRENKKFLEGLK